jgi:glycine oxidase
MQPRVLIIGGGLAGCTLAWQLHQRAVDFLLVDRSEPVTASKIAAGLITPITGMRLNLSWRYAELYPLAQRFYQQIELQVGAGFWHPVPIVRLLRDEAAAQLWQKRLQQPELAPFIQTVPSPLVDECFFRAPHGGFQMQQSGWLDTALYLSTSQAYFSQRGQWQLGEVSFEPAELKAEAFSWQGQCFSHVLFCTGWQAAQHPWFDWLPFRSARGSVLEIQAQTGGEHRIINRSCWLLPRPDGSYRAGPTYELNFPQDQPHAPAAEALEGLQQKLRAMLTEDFHIQSLQTAVRPILHQRELALGPHPANPRVLCLNGLGSKGALRAPWAAQQLLAALLDGHPVAEAWDLATLG